ncbi:MAG: hypothetical protein KatS3mg011_1223 [Acidimicrobiia bacterium]|nr:MAG: hypothetical protein KatS3mg011_1223 [Acidimicrobiia bacterium]
MGSAGGSNPHVGTVTSSIRRLRRARRPCRGLRDGWTPFPTSDRAATSRSSTSAAMSSPWEATSSTRSRLSSSLNFLPTLHQFPGQADDRRQRGAKLVADRHHQVLLGTHQSLELLSHPLAVGHVDHLVHDGIEGAVGVANRSSREHEGASVALGAFRMYRRHIAVQLPRDHSSDLLQGRFELLWGDEGVGRRRQEAFTVHSRQGDGGVVGRQQAQVGAHQDHRPGRILEGGPEPRL